MSENLKKSYLPDNSGAKNVNETSSRLSRIIFFLLAVMLVFSVVAFGAVDTWALGVSSLLTGLITVCWLADAWTKKELQLNSNALQLPLSALILIGLIQLLPLRRAEISTDLLSVSAVNSLSLAAYSTRLAVVQLIVYFIFFAAALTFVNNKNRLRKIVLTIIIFGALTAFFGIMQRLAGVNAIYGFRFPNQAVSFASFVNQHHFAAFMEMTAGLTLGLLFSKTTKNNARIFLLMAVVVMGIGLLLTGSRGGLISFLGVVGFVLAANFLRKPASEIGSATENGKQYSRNFAFIGGGLVLVLILFGAVILLGGDESLLRGVGLQNAEDASNGRSHFWRIALQIFFDYPILGAGLDSFGIAFTRYDTWNGTFRVEQAHNDYLQILADAGIAGFLCVGAYIFLLFKKGFSILGGTSDNFRRGVAVGALAGCFGVLIHSFFDFPLRTPSNALFFLMLSVLATTSIDFTKTARRKRLKKTI